MTSRRVGRAFSASIARRRRACRRSRAPRGDAGNNPCSRQGDQVVAPGSTGRRLPLEDNRDASGGTPMSSSPVAWRKPVVRSPGAHARIGVPIGEGTARPHSGRSRDIRPRARACARVRPRLRSSAPARMARSRVVPCGRLARGGHDGCRAVDRAGASPVDPGSGAAGPQRSQKRQRGSVSPRDGRGWMPALNALGTMPT